MFGWFREDAAFASRWKRLRACASLASSSGRNFRATWRPSLRSSASYTTPMPPPPMELRKELGETKSAPAGFFCLTVAPFAPNEPAPEIPDLLRRINSLLDAGGEVLLFRKPELYHMTALVN